MSVYLKSEKLGQELDHKGFVKFPLLGKKEVSLIKAFYDSVEADHIRPGTLFDTTLNTSRKEVIEKTHLFLYPFFENALKKHTANLNYTLAGFLTKRHGRNSAVTIHQDWNYVDESRWPSYSFWLSLDDTGLLNGCMQFIPGSHKFHPSLRISPDIPDYFESYKRDAADYLVDVPSKAGECIMFNQAIIHASRRNYSKAPRIACNLGAYPQGADLLHYYLPPDSAMDAIEKWKISNHSLLHMRKDQRPEYAELVGHVSYSPPEADIEEFLRKCRKHVGRGRVLRTRVINALIGTSI